MTIDGQVGDLELSPNNISQTETIFKPGKGQ